MDPPDESDDPVEEDLEKQDVDPPTTEKSEHPEQPATSSDFETALDENQAARTFFDGLPEKDQRAYVKQFIESATPEQRPQKIKEVIERLVARKRPFEDSLLPFRLSFSTYVLTFLAPVGALILLTLILPGIFYDGFVGPYLWDPIAGDSGSSSAQEGYNLWNTLTYGVILVGALYGLLFLFRGLDLAADARFVFSLVPFILTGAFWRTLEDARAFGDLGGVTRFLFISPLIYIFLAVVVVTSIFIGVAARLLIARRGLWAGLIPVAGLLFVLAALEQSTAMPENIPPVVHLVLMVAVLGGVYLVWWRWPTLERALPAISAVGIYFAAMGLYLLIRFYNDSWPCIEDGLACNYKDSPDLAVLWPVIGLDLLAGGLFFGGVWAGKKYWPSFAERSMQPIMILMVFAQFFDAAATYYGIDVLGYGEKHVLPDFLIQNFGTAIVMFPLKLVIIIPGIWLLGFPPEIDHEADAMEQMWMRADRDFWGLVTLVMITLGLAPGGRDVLRALMGV